MRIPAVLCLALLLAGLAECVTPSLGKGTREVSVHGFWDPEGARGSEFDLTGSYGFFAADSLFVGATAGYAHYEDALGLGMETRILFVGGFFEYNLDMGMLTVPYAGFEAGYASYKLGEELSGSAIVYGPRAGMKYFLSENVALDFSLKYLFANDSIFVRKGEHDNSKIYASFGVRALF